MKPSSASDDSPSWTALAAFLTDEATGHRSLEGEPFREWVSSSDRPARMANVIQDAWMRPGAPAMVAVDTVAAFQAVSLRAGIRTAPKLDRHQPRRRWMPYVGGA